MEEWELIVEKYEDVERKSFLKACECAHHVLKDDLAPLEIVWFLDTLILEPVNILKTIAAKSKEPVWLEPIGKAFKLLSDVIEKFPEECTQHFENIVRLCEKSFEARPRAFALQCLTSLVPYYEAAAENYNKHLVSLMNENICKAALAELIGAICSHYTDIVKSNVATIWRVYLNLFDSRQSDTVVRSLLLGVSGVLKSFGNDLDIKEFPVFYKHLVDASDKSKCRDVYLKILAKHADLFRELLANDPETRMSLWHSYPTSDPQGVNRQAILSVYNAIKQVFKENRSRFNAIVRTETFQFENSSNSEIKFTALRVLHAVNARVARVHCDMQALYALRHCRLTYEHCEMIQWCLEYNIENDIKLLKSVLVFYENIPTKYQKVIVVNILLKAPHSVRKMAVIFLITETCQCYKDNGNIDKYIHLWKSLFITSSDELKNKSGEIFLDFMEYLYQLLMQNNMSNSEEISDKLSYLITISWYIIPMGDEVVGERVCDVSRGVVRLLGGAGGAGLRVARLLLRYGAVDLYSEMVKDISLENCTDDLMLYETCLALVYTATRVDDVRRVLHALQIILSRSDVEASILSRCIITLDNIMSTRKDFNGNVLNQIIHRLEKIQYIEHKGKDGRCLRRDLFMFLGKYSKNTYKDEYLVESMHLEKYMNLAVPIINEGIIIKLNLQQMHSLALKYEDTKMLQILHELLYANLWERAPNENTRRALCRSACALLRARPQLRTRIITMCGDTSLDILLQFVDTESSEIRTAACNLLRQISQHEKLTHTMLYDSTLCSVNKPAFLDVSEMIVDIMKDDNILAKKYLPTIILEIFKININKANKIYKIANDLFIDKIELFRNVLNNVESELLNGILVKQDGRHVNKMADVHVIKDKIKLTLDFIKQICGMEKDWFKVIQNFIIVKQNGDNSRLFLILSIAKEMFDFDENTCHRLLEGNFVCEQLFMVEDDLDLLYLEGILNFFTQYAEILVKLHLENTVKVISNIILKLKPEEIIEQSQNLFSCLKIYEKLLGCYPEDFLISYELWCKEWKTEKIVFNLENDIYEDDVINMVKSIKIFIDIFNENIKNEDIIKEIKKWLPFVIDNYKNGIKKRYIPYFSDLLHVMLRFLSTTEVESVVMMEGFCGDFMPVVFDHLVMKPYCLIKKILHQKNVMKVLVKYSKLKDYDVLDLVNQLWPEFEKVSTFEQQHSLLLEVSYLPNKLPPESNPMQWLIDTITSDTSTCEMKAKLIGLLPPGESYKSTWSWYAGLLPARLSEAEGENGLLLGALLEALIAADCSLLKTISHLIAGETTKGWWDDAIDACVVSLSKSNDISIYDTLYTCCWEGLSLGVCVRLMVPLLRNSTAAICEEFFSLKLKDLLSILKKKPSVSNRSFTYQMAIVDYIRALILLRVCIEMVPRSRIESSNSLLYSQMLNEVGTNVFYLTKTLSMLCVDLVKNRPVSCPNDADDSFKKICLLFYCENYNSLASAVWCRQPSDPKFYSLVFDKETWCRIVDPDMEYELPLVESWQKYSMYQFASVELEDSSCLLSSSSKTRTRTYLRTLSENPEEFDVGVPQDDQECHQELCISENVINLHPCAGILTMCVSRATSLSHPTWLHTILNTLTADIHTNTKCLLAQAICNCKEDLRVHASVLHPALLTMVVQTSDQELNSLHIDIIDTIIYWGNQNLIPDIKNLNLILEKLIRTIIKYRRRKKIVSSLIQKMHLILHMFEHIEIKWTCLSECVHVKTDDTAFIYIEIIKTITKKLYIPELIIELVKKLQTKDTQTFKHKDIAFIFARCVNVMPIDGRYEMLKIFRDIIQTYNNNIKEYIDIILYAQKENTDICNIVLFRRIADLLPKMVDRNRTKCLEILSLCLNNVPSNEVISLFESREVSRLVQDGDSTALVLLGRGLSRLGRGLTGIGRGLVLQTEKHCRSDVKKVREAAYGVLRSAVECLFTDSLESNPKRSARFSSPLLQDEELNVALASLGIELMSDDKLRNSVSSCLPTSIATRFCESFIISVYLPVVYGNNKSVNCLTTFLDIFFKELSDNEAFKRNLISDTMKNKLATTSKDSNLIIHSSYQNEDLTTEETKTMDVLETLLQFSKTGEAASALTLTLLTSLSGTIRGFDFPAAMTQLLLPMLSQVGDITPFVIEACRLLVDECSTIPRFKPAVEELMKSVKGTEGEILLQVLLEDVDVRLSGIDYFVLGANKLDEESEMMDLSKEFSLEDVVTSFDSLSNWQLLTRQQQKSTSDRLPPLWTCMSDFRKHLDSWQVTTTSTWFDKMLSIYQESKKSYKSLQWFNEMSRWPKRQFTISATIDALELKRMQDEEHPQDLECHIQPQDCLVEWAARIMTRSACIQKMSENMESMTSISPSHSHALRWCTRANEMALPLQVLRCIQTIDKQELATLAWRRQELLARRQLALKTSDMDILSLLLETAHSYESENRIILDNTTIEDIIGLKHLILILEKDVGALSNEQLRCILYDTKDKIKTSESRVVGENKQMLKNMVQIAITHYDENWPLTGVIEQNIQLKEITNALGVGIDLNLDLDYSVLVDVLLYRLSCADQLDNDATDAVLGKMDTLIHILDDFAIEELKRNQFKLTSPCELVTKLSRDTSKLKQCLQLVADPRHMLRHYVRELLKALENLDDAAWTKSFNRMKEKIFENPYAGVDYQVLIKYKEILYKISEFDLNNKDSIKESLLILLKELNSQSESFKLSQLCPALTQAEFLCGSETEDCLSRLLMLPRGVHVHRFDEQVSVFTDSKRRPVVLSARLSDGSRRRLLVKTGEELGVDAAALRVIRAMRLTTQDYQVTSLGDDSGLIEYLEDHERVREMISKKYDVKGIESLSTLGEKLIYDTREHSISQYQKMCAKIPAHAFRSVMELNSISFQDFIYKKKNYEESLSAMTYATSLLGLKDRHLENILYDVVRGSVRSVDWNSALQHDQCEPPPARLTRCLLAPCRKQVLESRLQTLTSETRFYHRFLQATLQISFKWMENNIQDKLQTVYDLMRGTKLSHQASQRSPGDFALLIDNIFKDFIYKDIYTIEEQVTNLLRHCTDPQILAITRSAWEPWI